MKRILAGLLALGAALTVQAQSISGAPYLAVHGNAKAELVPDVFPLDITLQDTSLDAAATQVRIEALAADILATAKALRLADADVTVSNMRVSPEYRYDRTTEKQVFLGNLYQREIKLRFHALPDLAKMVGSLPNAKEVRVETGEFETSRADEVRRSLTGKAVEDARRTAEAMAAAVGRKLGAVHNVSNQGFNVRYVEGGFEGSPVVLAPPKTLDSVTVSGSRLSPELVLRQGRITLEQDVYVIYTLQD